MAYDIHMEDGWAVTDRLVGLGLDPLGIELVVLTHMHNDHVGAVAQLPRATFVVDGREWDAADDQGFLHGYRHQLYDYDYDWRALDFAAANVDSFASFGRTIDLFGDGSVRLLSTPGHTRGHMSVLLRLRSGRELLLDGRRRVRADDHRAGAGPALLRRRAPLPALAARDPPLPRADPQRPGGLRPRSGVLAAGPRQVRMRT